MISEARNTIANFTTEVTPTSNSAGIMNTGIKLISIKTPTETKNKATNISLMGVVKMLVTACDFDSAINTPAKKAPAATEIPSKFETYAKPKARPRTGSTKTSL
ncbi:hypothetical protein BH23THE1_BH23THE1_34630 [soil metagenome]